MCIAFRLDICQRDRPSVIGFFSGIKKDQFLKLLDAMDRIFSVFPKLFARDEEHLGTGILEDKSYLLDRLCRVDRHVDGTQAKDRKIYKGPLGPIFGDDGHAVTRFYAQSCEAHGDTLYSLDDLVAVDVFPHVIDLVRECITLVVPRERLKAIMRYRLRDVFETYEIFSDHECTVLRETFFRDCLFLQIGDFKSNQP